MHEDDQVTPETIRSRHRAPRRPRTPVVALVIGAVVLLAGLGAAGPAAPVTSTVALPPPDTSLTGATGRLPDAGVAPLPGIPDVALPGGAALPDAVDGSTLGIPETVLAAYRAAATTIDRDAPGCRLTWPLVAGIGKVESGHAVGGAVGADGTTRRPILGPQLTGTGGNAAIRDTDGGALDHDATWDRAVGPTQFIPSSWRVWGADGNGDGRTDPDNVFDAALATARYLCSGGGDLTQPGARHDAVFRYNHSEDYVATVLRWADAYASGALPVPDSAGPGGSGSGSDGTAGSGSGPDDVPVTLAALPSSSSFPVPTAGAPAGLAAPAPPVGTPGGAPRPGPVPSPTPLSASTTPTTGATGAVAAAAPHMAPAPSSPTPPSSSTTASSTTASSTTASSTTASSTGSASAPSPAAHARPPSGAAVPASRPPSTTPPSSTSTPPSSSEAAPSSTHPSASSTTSPSTTTSAARCAALVPTVATASGIAAGQVTATSSAGPGAGRTTCTVRGPQGPVLVAVSGTPAPPVPAVGVSRTLEGGRTVLTVPGTSGLTPDRAKAVLTALAATWP